ARLVQLGAQHLDLVAEVLGVLDRLLPLGLQPLHLGFEPREVVDVSRRLSLLALVAPHCAVPSVPWSQVWPGSRPSAERGPRGMVSDQRLSMGCCPGARPPKPDPGGPATRDGRTWSPWIERRPHPTLPAHMYVGQCSGDSTGAEVTSSVSTPSQSLGCRKVIRDPMEPRRGSSYRTRTPLSLTSAASASTSAVPKAMWWTSSPFFGSHLATVESSRVGSCVGW